MLICTKREVVQANLNQGVRDWVLNERSGQGFKGILGHTIYVAEK